MMRLFKTICVCDDYTPPINDFKIGEWVMVAPFPDIQFLNENQYYKIIRLVDNYVVLDVYNEVEASIHFTMIIRHQIKNLTWVESIMYRLKYGYYK